MGAADIRNRIRVNVNLNLSGWREEKHPNEQTTFALAQVL